MSLPNKLPPELLEISERMPSIVWNALVAGIAIFIGLIAKAIITRILKYYEKKADYKIYSFFRSFIIHLGVPFTYFIPLFLLNISLPLMRMDKLYYDPLDRLIDILLTLAFANILISCIRVGEDYIYHLYDLNKADNLKERKIRTQLSFIRKLVVAIIIFVTIAIILLSFESMRKIGTGLLTGVGVGGIIVGFAAQTSLGNLLAGFQIAFTQPIRIDDVLVVEGEWGRVEDITLTYVVLRIWDQRRLILPINYFITKPFQNWTRISADILGTVFIYMDYSIPIEPLRKEFDDLLTKTKLWDGKVKVLQITDAKEKTIEIRLLMSSGNSSDAFDLRCFIRENMITYIQKNYPESLPKLRAEFIGTPFQTPPSAELGNAVKQP
ncbi:mechanosensitive ion channel family protein [Mucilaginibacter jinjuensis]|uniref:Mechanosensitive ion channel n=1 Tax=Mucilaginibacter jinjuensis TaxID=1176721 RepID=A0ABY7T1H7_9SPHI|nr:mechanosensitive ion channel domain-containing protein [Mucilaginibacter jinjuensis]WCT10277.1 mechanosensitive ion channel [Mucilaginibacter jinjuensis]